MFDRKKLDRERLEITLVYIMLAQRALFTFSGLCALFTALVLAIKMPTAALVLATLSIAALVLGQSYNAVVLLARFLSKLVNH